ncbi:MAG: DNA translocase FtsK 4TM domain-containing protein, partial [Vicinamibacterales bacterium]
MAKGSTVSRRVSEFTGVALFAAALIWIVALVTYSSADPVWFFSTASGQTPANFAGRVGAFLAELSFQLVGYAAYAVPVVFVVVGWHAFWCRDIDAAGTKVVGAALLTSCSSAFLSLVFGTLETEGRAFRSGGYVGEFLAAIFTAYLNRTGSVIIVLTLIVLSVILSTQVSIGRVFAALMSAGRASWTRGLVRFREWRDERQRERQRREVIAKHTKKGTPVPAIAVAPAQAAAAAEGARPMRRRESAEEDPPVAVQRPVVPPRPPKVAMPAPPLPLPDPEPMAKAPAERRKGDYGLPPLALLDAARTERKIDERELMDGARLLEEKCREFSVEGSVVQIHPGPVVTTYEFKPDAGVKYSKITGLSEDLCLAMQAESVLIDRIPGKSTVGIQIPNHNREQISLRELLESEVYRRSTSKLTIALGKTIHGEPYMADLSAMPHLLIAGSTGTGKSVGINSMLTSVLYRATPDDVRLIMIDPKRLELGMYEDIPHLLTPVVVDPKQAANALRWAVREMEERYKTLAAEGVRNIEQYNRNIRQAIEEKRTPRDGETPRPLPFIIVL